MGNSTSVLGMLWGWVKSLAVLAGLGWVAWYAFSLWNPTSPGISDSETGTTFNCRKALKERESDYACLESDSCTMTSDEMAELKAREADIDQHCNLGFNPMPNVDL